MPRTSRRGRIEASLRDRTRTGQKSLVFTSARDRIGQVGVLAIGGRSSALTAWLGPPPPSSGWASRAIVRLDRLIVTMSASSPNRTSDSRAPEGRHCIYCASSHFKKSSSGTSL
jgi:hypothetical protein